MGWFWSEWQRPWKRQGYLETGSVPQPRLSTAREEDSSRSIFSGLTSTSSSGEENGSSPSVPAAAAGGGGGKLNTIAWCIATATIVVGGTKSYKLYVRRIRNAEYLKPHQLRKKSLFGSVTRVGDGDNFRFYHTPLGRLAGWGWSRHVPTKTSDLKDETLHIRIAGIDAPELPHFGRPGQPFAQDAWDWLTQYLLHRRVRILPLCKDQYGRVVGTVHVWRWGRRDVGLEMIRAGWATVYEAKTGAEYAGKEEVYRAAEARARQKRLGMWRGPTMVGKLLGVQPEPLESPREFKTRAKKEESAAK